jgi:hypothetical protein
MQPIFPQDSLPDLFKYFDVFIECRSLPEPRQGSTFHVDFQAFLQCSKQKTDTSLIKMIPVSLKFSLVWALCEGGLWQNDNYQRCSALGDANPRMSHFSLGTMVLNNLVKHSEKIKVRKVSSSTII